MEYIWEMIQAHQVKAPLMLKTLPRVVQWIAWEIIIHIVNNLFALPAIQSFQTITL